MSEMSNPVRDTWERRNGPAVFTTVSADGIPNSIYVTCLDLYDDRTVLIADNYFDKTRRNIREGSPGVLLYIPEDSKAVQIKGTLTSPRPVPDLKGLVKEAAKDAVIDMLDGFFRKKR